MPQTIPDAEHDELFRQQAMVLKALANASRLRLVERLLHGPCPVSDLVDLVPSDRTTVSKHLGVLRAHGIVRDRREAGAVVYELRTPCVANIFTCTRAMLEERTTPMRPATRRRTAAKAEGGAPWPA